MTGDTGVDAWLWNRLDDIEAWLMDLHPVMDRNARLRRRMAVSMVWPYVDLLAGKELSIHEPPNALVLLYAHAVSGWGR